MATFKTLPTIHSWLYSGRKKNRYRTCNKILAAFKLSVQAQTVNRSRRRPAAIWAYVHCRMQCPWCWWDSVTGTSAIHNTKKACFVRHHHMFGCPHTFGGIQTYNHGHPNILDGCPNIWGVKCIGGIQTPPSLTKHAFFVWCVALVPVTESHGCQSCDILSYTRSLVQVSKGTNLELQRSMIQM